MPKPTKKMGNASAEWSLQASNLNVNDAVLAKFEHDMDVVLQHHVFSDVKTMKPVEIVEGAAKHEAGHQAGLLVGKKMGKRSWIDEICCVFTGFDSPVGDVPDW